MLNIGIITGSTRTGRVNLQVAEWVNNIAAKRTDANYELIDIKDFNLPPFDAVIPAVFSDDYPSLEVQAWSKKIASLDGFIFITAEYNRGVTPALKTAIDYLFKEFNNKVAGIVSYGSSGGTLAAAQLRIILTTPKVATVGTQPALNLFTDFVDMEKFAPADFHEETINTLIDEVVLWSKGLKTIRN